MATPLLRTPVGSVVFGPFRMDPERGELWRGNERVHLRPKSWEVLCLLVANPGRLLTKDDIIDAVWGGAAVGDTMPSISVAELRRALEDDAKQPRFVETVHRRGFRFIADTVRSGSEPDRSRQLSDDRDTSMPRFVGRATELRALEEWISSAGPHGRTAFVCGEAGIGKTSLVNALLERIESSATDSRRFVMGRGQCLAYFGDGHSHLPVLGALRTMCSGSERLVGLLREVAPSWLVRLPTLVPNAELTELRERTAAVAPARSIEELTSFLRAVGPVVWTLEDLHWSDEATLDLLCMLADDMALTDFSVIITVRLAEAIGKGHAIARMRRELLRRGRCRDIMLEGLSERDIRDYLACRLPSTPYPAWLPRRLLSHSNGNPFFVVHTVDHLKEEGVLPESKEARPIDEARLERALAAVPATLRELIEEEIGRLEPAERRVLGAASLGGLEVDAATVAAALDDGVEEIDTICWDLARRTALLERADGERSWPDGTVSGRYSFQHALYQKVLYDNQPPAAKRAGHCRIARKLIAAFGEGTTEVAAEIADHFERGGASEAAIDYHLVAAQTAGERYASSEAALHLRRALALLPQNASNREAREAAILGELGKVLPALQGYRDPELQTLYVQARSLLSKGAGASLPITLMIGQLLAHLMQRRPEPAEQLARELLEMAAHTGDGATQAHAEILMGAVLYYQGDLAGTIEHADRAMLLAPDSLTFGPLDQKSGALGMSGAACWQAGRPDEGLARALRGRDGARGEIHPFNRIVILQALGAIQQWRGDVEGTMTTARELAADVEEQGILQAGAIAAMIEGWVAFVGADLERAGRKIDEGLASLRQYGSMMQSVYLLAVAAEVLMGLGRSSETAGLLDEADALLRAGEARWWEPEIHRLRGALYATAADGAALAEESLLRALHIAAQQGSHSLTLRASIDLARLRRSQGRSKEADKLVAAALSNIEGGAETRDVLEARKLLGSKADKKRIVR